jgi:hypothetical protein
VRLRLLVGAIATAATLSACGSSAKPAQGTSAVTTTTCLSAPPLGADGVPDQETIRQLGVNGGCFFNTRSQATTTTPSTTTTQPSRALPSYTPPNPPGYPAAQLAGVLSVRDGCAYLDGGDTLLVWFPGTHLSAEAGRMTVVSPSGNEIGVIGENVVLGGGYVERNAPMLSGLQTACTSHQLAVVAPSTLTP